MVTPMFTTAFAPMNTWSPITTGDVSTTGTALALTQRRALECV